MPRYHLRYLKGPNYTLNLEYEAVVEAPSFEAALARIRTGPLLKAMITPRLRPGIPAPACIIRNCGKRPCCPPLRMPTPESCGHRRFFPRNFVGRKSRAAVYRGALRSSGSGVAAFACKPFQWLERRPFRRMRVRLPGVAFCLEWALLALPHFWALWITAFYAVDRA